jgi:multiple sugar transport system substrate-binding protein
MRAAAGAGFLGTAWAASACGAGADGGTGTSARRALPASVTFVIQSNAGDHTRYWQQFVAWFEQEHAGTKVEAILPPGEGPYETKVLTMLAGGTTLDLFHLNNRYIYDFAGRELLQPLDQLLRRASFPLADIIPGVLIPYRINNQLVGIPRDNATGAIYYNKDLFAAAGVKEPATSWTWDDYLEAARKLTSPDRGRFGSTFPQIETLAPATHLSFVRSFGGDWFDAGMKEVTIDRPGAMRAFQFALDLRFRHGVVARPNEAPPGDQLIGQVAAINHEQQGYVQRVKRDAPGLRWDMAPLPRGPAGRTSVVGTTGYCIPKQSSQPDAGAVLLTYLLGERVQKDMMSEGRWTTPRKSLVNFAIPGDGQPSRFKEAIVEPLLAAKGVAMPAGFADMESSFVKEMQPVWTGQRSLQEGLTLVKQQWSQLLEANRTRR